MQSCSLLDSDRGYQEARRLLKSRYGQPCKIASAYVDKVVNGPQIKSEDGEALRRFSVLLTSCRNTQKGTEYLSKIDNPDSLRGIVNRLPYDARKRWRFTADSISEREERQVTLDDIANFVEREGRAATHPVFGDISGNLKDTESHKKKPPVRPKSSSFGTQTNKTDANKDKHDVDRWHHLHVIQVSEFDVPVGLLVGNDNIRALEPKEIRQIEGCGPYATKTRFGWAINGPLGSDHKESKCNANLIKTDHELNERSKNFCNREFSECIADSELGPSQDDQRAISIMKKSVKLKDNHYEISLPWRDDPPCLPNSRPIALHRLGLLKKRLQRNLELHGRYSTVIDDMLSKGYAQKVPEEERIRQDGFVWYSPHHPVHHPLKPDKTRVVFDCSAKYCGTSLHDKLLQGRDLTNTLMGVLTRFRQEHIAMMADIECMFHQVRVTPEHCDALRFLWWPEGDLNQAPKDYRMQVHLFGTTSSPSCANFGLQKVADDNEEKFSCDVIETAKRNFYVDDCLKLVNTEDTAITLPVQLSKLLQNGGF